MTTKTDYQNQAREFLNKCGAQMSITYAGEVKPRWDNKSHRMYICIIKTQRGEMIINFYDSTRNTELWEMTPAEYISKYYNYAPKDAPYNLKIKANNEIKKIRAEATPTEYDILACLTTYDVGSIDDFMQEFGYQINCVEDMTNFIETYNAVVKEYNDVKRCFTSEQIELLAEIN